MPPVKPSVTPQVGELWKDLNGDHNLVLEVYEDDGEDLTKLLTLETGKIWPSEPLRCWNSNPFYFEMVG